MTTTTPPKNLNPVTTAAAYADEGIASLEGISSLTSEDLGKEFQRLARKTIEHWIAMGRILHVMRGRAKSHVEFGKWRREWTGGFSSEQCRRFERVAEVYGDKFDRGELHQNVAVSVYSELAQPHVPEAAREALLAKIDQGERPTVKDVKQYVAGPSSVSDEIAQFKKLISLLPPREQGAFFLEWIGAAPEKAPLILHDDAGRPIHPDTALERLRAFTHPDDFPRAAAVALVRAWVKDWALARRHFDDLEYAEKAPQPLLNVLRLTRHLIEGFDIGRAEYEDAFLSKEEAVEWARRFAIKRNLDPGNVFPDD